MGEWGKKITWHGEIGREGKQKREQETQGVTARAEQGGLGPREHGYLDGEP